MSEVNWYLWGALWFVAWLWQNISHEGSHLWAGWLHEGRKPLKLIPVPHFHQGRFYFARYECGNVTKDGSPRFRHIAPFNSAGRQAWIVTSLIGFSIVVGVRSVSFYLTPFLVCPVVDMAFWVVGYWRRREGTDGARWAIQARMDGIKDKL